MQLLNILVASVLASIAVATKTSSKSKAAANTITFVNQDSTDRCIIFTPSYGFPEIEKLEVPGDKTAMATFPQGWVGNFFSINSGEDVVPGMLGEFSFDAWNGITFFDVSAIVNSLDIHGIKEIFPKNSNTPMSGCQDYTETCDNAYNLPNDDQTKSSQENDYICLIGTLANSRRRGVVARDVAEQKMKRVVPLTGEPVAKQ